MRFFERCNVARSGSERLGLEACALPAGLALEPVRDVGLVCCEGAIVFPEAPDSLAGAGAEEDETGDDGAGAAACDAGDVTLAGATGVGVGAVEVGAEVTVVGAGVGSAGGGEVTVTGRADVTGSGGSKVVTGNAGTVTVAVTPGRSGGSPSASACAAANPARAATTQKILPKRDMPKPYNDRPAKTARACYLLGLALVLRDRVGSRHRIRGSRHGIRGSRHRIVRVVVAGVGMIVAGVRIACQRTHRLRTST